MRGWEHGTNWVFHQEPEVGEDQVSSEMWDTLKQLLCSFDSWRYNKTFFDGWRLDFRPFDDWRLTPLKSL